MRLSKQILKNLWNGLKISVFLGLCTLVVTGILINNSLSAATITPTTNSTSELTSTLYRSVPSGYTKPNYTFTMNPESNAPTANDLSPADAAEIISQEIYRYFKMNISDKTIELSLDIKGIDNKSSWSGKMNINSNSYIHVNIEGVTGEVNSIRKISTTINHPIENPSEDLQEFEKQVDTISDDIKKNIERKAKENSKKIEELIISSGFIPETIKSITYTRCGVRIFYNPEGINLEPTFSVVTTSGKDYLITLSEDLMSIEGLLVLTPVNNFNNFIPAK